MAYNGFTNWQTWNFHNWHGEYCHSMAEDGATITEEFLRDLIDYDLHRIPDGGLIGDFIDDAIDQINFYELCELYNFDNDDEEDDLDGPTNFI